MAGEFFALDVKGDRELARALSDMSDAVNKRIRIQAAFAGASPVLAATRAAAPKETELLSKSIKARRAKQKVPGSSLIVLGPTSMKRTMRILRKGKNAGKFRGVGKKALEAGKYAAEDLVVRNPAKYAHLVEFGRTAVTPKKRGALAVRTATGVFIRRSARFVPPRPFMRTGFAASASASAKRITEKAEKEIMAQARRSRR